MTTVEGRIEELERAMKGPNRIVSFSGMTDAELQTLEDAVQKGMNSKMQSEAMASLHPKFDWWTVSGIWPDPVNAGWRVLLRKIRVEGQQQAPRLRQ